MTRWSRGFTLIELAIALTVIGLLMAGVLMGSSVLIEKSRVASLLSKIKDLGAASRDFKSRYGYFPGDMPNAGNYITADGGMSVACAPGGNGNGVVDSQQESVCATEHLVKAGLLTKAESDTAGYFIGSGFEGGGRVSLWRSAANENVVRVTLLPCNVALELDRKLDSEYFKPDGVTPMPLGKGVVIGVDALGNPIDTCAPGGDNDPLPALLVNY